MASRKRVVSRRTRRAGKKSKPFKSVKAGRLKKKTETKKPPALVPQVAQKPIKAESLARERFVITVDNIRGDTAIGDLLVTFPRTRDVLVRKGLKLEAENAGDIYMTLDAFSAMNGLEIVSLVHEIMTVAREPPPQPAIAQVVVPPIP
ncbi:MAG: hypothetical protein AUI50_00200 [Crenarchaeota archaeon 13_1_40CM_2_52_14]|nr:MAG: hypothetical protein AUI97_05880 [Crenarchaeota archaeon 13_1_40CM_3_52_17]OLD35886.1 MAG: hypothetical protein AUI50_00200 [Crenarchaeota archaeon 13_1_40CM_2_52_14]